MSNFFKDWIFNQFPRYHQENDTYVDGNGDGLLKRYLRTFGMELDEEFVPYIDNFTNLIDVIKCDDKFLPLIGSILGYPPSIDGTSATYRKILAYAVAIYKIKGTLNSFQILFNLLGFNVSIIEEIPKKKITYDGDALYDVDGNIYDSDCDHCSGYYLQYTPINGAPLTSDQLTAISNIISFLNPINATFLGMLKRVDATDDVNLVLNDSTNFCGLPSNLYGTYDPNTSSAKIYWSNLGIFQLQYRQQGVGNFSAPVTVNSGYQINGLTTGDTYEVQVRQNCTGGINSPWVTLLLFTQNGVVNQAGFGVYAGRLEYIADSTDITLLTDYSLNFDVPIYLLSLLIDGSWIIANKIIGTIADMVNYLNTLNMGNFTSNGNTIIALDNPHVLSKISYEPLDSTDSEEVEFKQYGQRVPGYPTILKSNYSINLDTTNPIVIHDLLVNGVSQVGDGTILSTQQEVVNWLNVQGIGVWAISGSNIISTDNLNCIALLNYELSGTTDLYTVFFNQRDIRINTTTDKLLLTDYSIELTNPITIVNILINGITIPGPGSLLNTLTDVMNWLNTLGYGTFQILNGLITSVGNQNDISQLTFDDGGTNEIILFTQFNQRIQNFDGTVTTVVANTTINDDSIYGVTIPAGTYNRITLYLPSNTIPITGGILITDNNTYNGFLDNGNLVLLNVTIGTFSQIIIK